MGWTAINASRPNIQIPANELSSEQPNGEDEKPSASACGFRANILAAAQKLANDVPRKRRRMSICKQRAVKKTTTPCSKTPRRSSNWRSRVRHDEDHIPIDAEINGAMEKSTFTLSTSSSGPKLCCEDNNSSSTLATEHSNGHHSLGAGIADACNPFESAQSAVNKCVGQAKAPPSSPTISVKQDQVIDLSSADSSYNDDFDESVFDEAIRDMITTPPSTFTSTPATSSSTFSSENSQHTLLAAGSDPHPNDAPFAPFMHPCLLDSVNTHTLHHKHVCFRAAEFLQLCKSLQSCHKGFEDYTVEIDLFACVHKVKFANSLGEGQGVVFSDIFFPNKPPYVNTVSRTPYSSKDILPDSMRDSNHKDIVKAAIRMRVCFPLSKSTKAALPLQTREQKRISRLETTYEVTDIQTTTWKEVQNIKRKIEWDSHARSPSKKNTTVSGSFDGYSDKENWDDFSDNDLPELATLFAPR